MAVKRDKVMKTAEKYVGRGKIDAAIKEYLKLLKEQPNDVNTLNRIGDLYSRIDREDEAIRFFKQIAEQYSRDGFFVKAIAIYKKIIRIDPSRLAVYEQLAELYGKQGLMNEARAQFQVLVDHYLKNDDDAAAINVYQKLVDLEPENPSHHLKLGELYQKRRLFDQAQAEYRKIAELMLEHERGEEAAKVYERAIEMHPQDLSYVSNAVLSLKDAGFVGPAARLLHRAVELNPEAERIQRQLGTAIGESMPAPPVPPPPEPEAFEIEDLGGTEEAIDLGELDVDFPAVEVEEEVGAAEQVAGPAPAEDGGLFDLDLDAEETSGLVVPPPDMDRPGTAFQIEEEEESPAEALGLGEAEGTGLEIDEEGFALEDVSLELDEEIELDLGAAIDLEAPAEIQWGVEEAPAESVPPPAAPPARTAQPETPVAEVTERPEDLLAEAEVFAKYGLGAKALERLEQVLALEPENLEALRRRVEIALADGETDRLDLAATMFGRVALSRGERVLWLGMVPRLEAAGFDVAAVEATVEARPEVAAELEELEEVEAEIEAEAPPVAEPEVVLREEAPPPAARPPRRVSAVDRALEELTSEMLRPRKERPAPPPPSPDAETLELPTGVEEGPAAAGPPAEIEEEAPEVVLGAPEPVGADDDFEAELPGIRLPEERIVSTATDPLDESGMHWLEDAAPPAAAASGGEILFDDEEEFFDLAAELEEELTKEEARLGADVIQPEEPSLEEIVEGFKRGVAENLSQEDYATHYNLGIAYREMGLLDEAIGEFQLASKSEDLRIECCSMLGMSFLEKGLPELAVKWYQKGLETPGLQEATRHGLMYDMAAVHSSMGDDEAARELFTEIYGNNSQFRDVGDRLEELRSGA
jgi:tetratricopeptide (TPR) repeat protein